MTNFEPSPWPDEIQDYFSEYSAIAWVPRFLHGMIADFTEKLAAVDPDFRYQDIQIWHDGTFRIRIKDENYYDPAFMEIVKTMSEELTNAYIFASGK